MSIAAMSDLEAGFFLLNSSSTDCEREHSNVVVEC